MSEPKGKCADEVPQRDYPNLCKLNDKPCVGYENCEYYQEEE